MGLPCAGVDLRLQLAENSSGLVCATHSDDVVHWSDQPFKQFNIGQVGREPTAVLFHLFVRFHSVACLCMFMCHTYYLRLLIM